MGSAINLSKSFWILIKWHWKQGSACMAPTDTSSHSLSPAKGYDISNPVPVPQLSPFKAYRTLGVYISPFGASNTASKVLKEKSDDYAEKITCSSLPREEALGSYLLHFIPIIGFPSILWHGAGPIDGHAKIVSAYRAETGGLINIFHILLSLCKYHGISGELIIIYCVCKSALNQLQRDKYGGVKDFLVPDYVTGKNHTTQTQ
jgi:hypothetical protein